MRDQVRRRGEHTDSERSGMMFGRKKSQSPETLSLEELLEGVNVGHFGSGYEHEVFRKFGLRYEEAADPGWFMQEIVPTLPGYDALATELIYRSRGIETAVVFRLPPEVEHFDSPACAVYRHPDAPAGSPNAWSTVRFYSYKVLPRFYEPIGIHDLIGWGLIQRFPPVPGSPLEVGGPTRMDETRGVVTFSARDDGAGRARDYATELGRAMEEVGVLCDPVVALGDGRDYDPLRSDKPHGGRDDRPHPYSIPWSPADAGEGGVRPRMDRKPRVHRIVPTAGPGVPDQETAEFLLNRLMTYEFWQGRKEGLDGRIEDPNIPAARLKTLYEQRQEAIENSEIAKRALLEEPRALLGLLLSMNDAVETLTDAVYPLMLRRVEESEDATDRVQLNYLQHSLADLFRGP